MDGARPVCSGLGRGGAAGDPLRGAPFFPPRIVQPRAPGALFSCRGDLRSSAASPGRLFAGRTESSMSAAGPDGAFTAARPLSPGGLRPHAAPGGPPVHGGGAPGSAPSGGRPALRWRSRRHPARASLPAPGRAGRTGPRGAFRRHREGPPIWLPGARPASMSPSRLKRNRRIIRRAPAPLREWACGPSRLRSFERLPTWCLTCGLLAFSGARRGHGALSAI